MSSIDQLHPSSAVTIQSLACFSFFFGNVLIDAHCHDVIRLGIAYRACAYFYSYIKSILLLTCMNSKLMQWIVCHQVCKIISRKKWPPETPISINGCSACTRPCFPTIRIEQHGLVLCQLLLHLFQNIWFCFG